MQENDYQNLYDYALKLLSLRPRSIKEISVKLKQHSAKKHLREEFITKAIENLKNSKLLDDRDFAKWWVEQRQHFRPKGKRHIQLELQGKGIGKEILEEIAIGKNEMINEYDLALRVIEKKKKHLINFPKEKLKMKIRDLLYRRGFDWDTIGKVVDYMVEKP